MGQHFVHGLHDPCVIGALLHFAVRKSGGDQGLLQSVLRADVGRFAVAARTFATDTMGFLIFLGLATVFLL